MLTGVARSALHLQTDGKTLPEVGFSSDPTRRQQDFLNSKKCLLEWCQRPGNTR